MSDWLTGFISWAAPPVIGAFIGFLTNDIAVRMLFRPLSEKRVFGIRVPFTPGIIPKQRRSLAASIGRMVSDELLTEEAVRAQIVSPRVQAALGENIAGLTSSILSLSVEELENRRLPVLQASLPEILKSLLGNFLKSPLFLSLLESLLDEFLDSLGRKKVREVVDELGLEEFLGERINLLINADAVKEKLTAGLIAWVRKQLENDAPLSSVVSDALVTTAVALFRSVLPHLLDALRAWLDTPAVRRNLEVKGILLLEDILSKLNIFQRFFISVGQYDRTLADQMPGVVSDFIDRASEALQSEKEREAVIQAFGHALESWRQKGFNELFGDGEGNPEEKIEGLVDRVFGFLRREKLSQKIAGEVGRYLVSREEDSLERLAASFFGLKKSDVTAFILSHFTKGDFVDQAADRISRFALDFFKSRGRLTLGELLGVDREKKAEFDARAVGALNEVLGAQLPQALRSLDLRGLVENKINALDMKSVEGLLLMVIARHLKWINVFGAILGFLIGLVQAILRHAGIG